MRTTSAVLCLAAAGVAAAACGGAAASTAAPPPVVTATTTSGGPSTPTISPVTVAPLGLAVSSVTFVSGDQGWVIGTMAGHARVEETTDGGAHWSPLAAVPPGAVTGIRFADATHGYAFSRAALDLTGDGGRSWTQLSVQDEDTGDGTGAADLEIADGTAWLLNAAAPYPSVYEAPVASAAFRKIGESGNRSAFLAVHGTEAYVVGEQGAGPIAPNLEVATTAGISKRTSPCTGPAGEGAGNGTTGGVGDLTGLAPTTTAGRLVAVCGGDRTSTTMTGSVQQSRDDGRTWSGVQLDGRAATGVADTADTAVVSCAGGGLRLAPFIGAKATTELTGVVVTYVGFTNDSDGVAIAGTSDGTDSGAGPLYVTRDGGVHWTKAAT